MENENKNPNENDANTGANNNESVGATNQKGTQSFDDFLSDPKNQAEFDRRVAKATKTSIEKEKEKWKLQNDSEKTEAERLSKMTENEKLIYQRDKAIRERDEANQKLDARDMKDEAIKIATEKDLDISLLNFIDFKGITAEKLKEKIDTLSTTFNKAVEKAVNNKLKEKTPKSKTFKDFKKNEISRSSI